MGVKLRGLLKPKKIDIEDLTGRTIAFDGHNVIYQFLAIIRGRDGKPLKDNKGRATSHLSGLIYRNSNLMEKGLRLSYVFDGEPHPFKNVTLRERKKQREEARIKYETAIREGKIEDVRRFGQQAVSATTDILSDAKRLLTLMGIPWVQSPGEGEAQSAYMVKKGDVWAAASQDFDSLLYGAPKLLRNLTITGRRKLPRKNVYIKIEPEIIDLKIFLKNLNITQKQLIDIGLMVGTDYNPKGIKGIGPKTALKLIQKHGNLEASIQHMKNADFPNPIENMKKLFLDPVITKKYSLEWNTPNKEGIIDFLCGERDFDVKRVLNAIGKIEIGFNKNRAKSTLDQWVR